MSDLTGLEPYSREWFVAQIGEEHVAYGEQVARDAPPPTPAQIELVRRLFAPQESHASAPETERPRTELAA